MKRAIIIGLVLAVLSTGFGLGAAFLFSTTAVPVGEYYKGVVLLDEDGYRDFKSKLAEGPASPKFDKIVKLETYASEGYLVDFDVVVDPSIGAFYGEHYNTRHEIPFPFTTLCVFCAISVLLTLVVPIWIWPEG